MYRQLNGLKAWYGELEAERTPYLNRAEKASYYTLPWYIKEDTCKGETLDTPYQSVGSAGVQNLASRLVMVLLPPNRPMFRLRVARRIIAETTGNTQKEKLITEISSALSRIETEATGLMEAIGDRTQMYTAMQHLLIAGNCLLYVRPDGMKVYSLRNYVVQRDPDGNPLTIIVKEEIARDALPKEVRRKLKSESLEQHEPTPPDNICEIYTAIVRRGDKWLVRQECEDILVGKPGVYPLDECPWIPLRLYRAEEEDYGRGYVEQYYGSLYALSVLSEAILDAAAASAKVVFLVHPGAVTKADTLAKADNLSFVAGRAEDIDILKLDKTNDLKIAQAQAQELTQQLSKAFLMNTAIQRDAERVTAEEIRYMAQELETALGGLYSVLAKELQRPYINLRLTYLQDARKLEPFPPDVEVEVITGIDALGRGQDATTLTQFGTQLFKTLPPDAVIQYINIPGYVKALAAAYGIDDTTVLKSEEQLAQQQAQQQQQALIEKLGPNAINAGSQLLQKTMEGEQPNV